MDRFVYVIESPAGEDLLDGRTEGRSLCELLRLAGIPHWYSLATTAATFDKALGERLVRAFEQFKKGNDYRYPILHLSMHGNKDGVALTDRSTFAWPDLYAKLRPLINVMPGQLDICMSSCHGLHGAKMAMDEMQPVTFRHLVGTDSNVFWADAAVAYMAMYHHLFRGTALADAVNAMRAASGVADFHHMDGPKLQQLWFNHKLEEKSEQLSEALRQYQQQGGLLGQGLSV